MSSTIEMMESSHAFEYPTNMLVHKRLAGERLLNRCRPGLVGHTKIMMSCIIVWVGVNCIHDDRPARRHSHAAAGRPCFADRAEPPRETQRVQRRDAHRARPRLRTA